MQMKIRQVKDTIFNFVDIRTSYTKHFHVSCDHDQKQENFVNFLKRKLSKVNTAWELIDYDSRNINGSARSLLELLLEGFDKVPDKPLKSSEFVKRLKAYARNHKPQFDNVILCLRNANCLHELESTGIIRKFFGGFGDPWFIDYVTIVTLSNMPWNMTLDNALDSPLCMQLFMIAPYSAIDDCKKIVASKCDFGKPQLSENFQETVLKSLEEHTNDPLKMYHLLMRVKFDCEEAGLNVFSEKVDQEAVRAYGKLSNDEIYSGLTTLFSVDDQIDMIPYYAKFVLLASYCASYNKSSADRRFFLKEREAAKRTAKVTEKKKHDQGPQNFSIQRLRGIASYLLSEYADSPENAPAFDVMLAQLIDMMLITRISALANINAPKFRCDAELEFIHKVALSVDISKIHIFLDEDPAALTSLLANFKIDE